MKCQENRTLCYVCIAGFCTYMHMYFVYSGSEENGSTESQTHTQLSYALGSAHRGMISTC